MPAREYDLKGVASLTSAPNAAPSFDLPFVVQGPWDDPLIFPDPESLIRRSPASAPLLDAVKDRKTRDAVRSVLERLYGGGRSLRRPMPRRPLGVSRSSRNVGMGVRWTRQRRARRHVRRAVFRERSTACRRTALERLRQSFRPVAHGRSNGLVKEAAYGKSVWSWHPWLVSSLAEVVREAQPGSQNRQFAGDGGKRNSSPGERAISRQTIAQGRPDALRWTCMLVCALLCAHCTRDRGCSAHPVFPAPSLGESFSQASGASRREIANAYSSCHRAALHAIARLAGGRPVFQRRQ